MDDEPLNESTSNEKQPAGPDPKESAADEEEVSPTKEMPRPVLGGYIDRFSARLREAVHRSRR